MSQLLKYLPQILALLSKVPDALKYLQYIPLMLQLIQFIREAQTLFEDSQNPEKHAKVRAKFIEMVDSFQSFGLLNPKVAESLKTGIDALITILVQIMKAAGGVPKVPIAEVVALSQ